MERCRAFALLELTVARHVAGSTVLEPGARTAIGNDRWSDGLAGHVVGELGAMVNVGVKTAVGATVTAGTVIAGGMPDEMTGATLRYRRWLTPSLGADLGTGLFRMPVAVVVANPWGAYVRNVARPAVAVDARLGARDLVAVTGRLMVATDGRGRTHHALFVGASTGSSVTAVLFGTLGALVALSSPRGDKVTVQ